MHPWTRPTSLCATRLFFALAGLIALPSFCRAAALGHYVSIGGTADSIAYGNTGYHEDFKPLIDAQPLQTFSTGTVNTSADDQLTTGGHDYYLHADAFATATVTMGALHALGVTHVTNSNAPFSNIVRGGGAPRGEWFDTITLNPGPGGSDFIAVLTLDDALAPSIAYPPNPLFGSANAGAQTTLFITDHLGLAVATLNIADSVRFATSGEVDNRPASYIQSFTIHDNNGPEVLSFDQQLLVTAGAFDGNADAVSNVGDTANFYLYSPDPNAFYTTDSGFSYVPEPGCLTLLGMSLLWGRRGRRRRPAIS